MYERQQQTASASDLASNLTPNLTRTWPTTYSGPERRARQGVLSSWLTHMLDEIDYGMLLVAGDAQLVYFNHAARKELDGEHPLQLMGRTLRAKSAQDVAPLFDALQGAQRGLRRLVTMGSGEHRISMSVVPLPDAYSVGRGEESRLTLVVLGKRRVCERLSLETYARLMNLTPAETRVLELLCNGVRAAAIARQQSVAVSTVRTQIGSIRNKVGAASINDVVRMVAVLPPLVTALRGDGSTRAG